MKKIISLLLCVVFVVLLIVPVTAAPDGGAAKGTDMKLNCVSAVLMEAKTGKVLYEQNADAALPPASVTKIMTLLLVMEAIDSGAASLDDTVTTGTRASKMGGSQIFLKEGEQMRLEDMLKSVVIASANDAAVALAEHIAGSEEVFVTRMNARAAELSMKNTHFENTNGLDDTVENHLTSARDIAIMSRELIKHKKILEYSSRWLDTVRNGEFGLTNTNRLIRFYNGATGLKTGSTSKAKFCISATAERGGLSLISVIMASPSRDERNEAAKTLLDWGFANYACYENAPSISERLTVVGGVADSCKIGCGNFSVIVPKGCENKITYKVELPENLTAPVAEGDKVGSVKYILNGKTVGEIPVTASENVGKISFFCVLLRLIGVIFMR